MIVHVGCTATREGITLDQLASVRFILTDIIKVRPGEWWLHHGDCVGGDKDISFIARRNGGKLESHPPSNSRLRAFVESDIVNPVKEYMDRNLDIVIASEFLIDCPKQSERQTRGGTWRTVGLGERYKKTGWIVCPSGSFTDLEPWK